LLGRSLRPLFESVVQRCIAEGMVSADGFAVCASHALNAERGARSRGFNGAERSWNGQLVTM